MGGVTLASKRSLSVSTDLIDLGEVMAAFEEMNNIIVEGRMRVDNVRGTRRVIIQFTAHDRRSEIGEVPPLASVRCVTGDNGHLTMESAIMWSLYQLDAQIAKGELDKSTIK